MKATSHLASLLQKGQPVVTAEVGPPKGADPMSLKVKAQCLRGFIDAANITDNQTAVVRLSSLAAALHLKEAGLEPVLQMTGRDRNRLAIQSDLLGAWSLGLRNVLCLTGDHQRFGNHPEACGVYDLDSIQMTDMVRNMKELGEFQCGELIPEGKPKFFIGAVENPFSGSLGMRVQRLKKKINAGAQFIQTQCIFDLPKFLEFMGLVRQAGLHQKTYILAGVTPLKSARMARFMRDNVAGISIPDDIVEYMEKAANPAQAGVDLCVEQIEKLLTIEGVAGIHIMAIAWEEIVPELVRRAGLYPRPE